MQQWGKVDFIYAIRSVYESSFHDAKTFLVAFGFSGLSGLGGVVGIKDMASALYLSRAGYVFMIRPYENGLYYKKQSFQKYIASWHAFVSA